MNPCIGDRQIDPPEDLKCDWCDGHKIMLDADDNETPCPYCQHDSDPGEPQDYPEE